MSSNVLQITTASRLHFGLLGVGSSSDRSFGGVGLMIDAPGLRLNVRTAEEWSAEGPLAQRALEFARQFAESIPDARPCRIVVESAPREHAGLGTGTQLGLAVAKVLAKLYGLDNLTTAELANRVGRGARSGLGVHGFEQGGFLVDGGKGPRTQIAPLLAHYDFPEEWRVLVVIPEGAGLSGEAERRAFVELDAEGWHSDSLSRLVLLGILPALLERDIQSFGEAVHEFNRRVGELFRARQGGVYASSVVAELVNFIRAKGVHGVGQSSWGPAVFAVVEAERAQGLEEVVRGRGEVVVACGANLGARTSVLES